MASSTPPAALLARLVASDPGRPRLTVYDDTDGPTRGERIELSARVLANWVAKAANLLQDELDVGPGSTVRLALPPHWRTVYWAFAAWTVGACVELPGGPGAADVVVTDDPEDATGGDVVLVTLAALARSAVAPLPPGAIDEAREVATHGDVVEPYALPEPGAVAWQDGSGSLGYDEVVPSAGSGGRVHTDTTDVAGFLRTVLDVFAGDGSVVLTRGAPEPERLADRLSAENVTRSVE